MSGSKKIGHYYVTRGKEIGIFIDKKYQGCDYGKCTINHIMNEYSFDTQLYANINPLNEKSINLFEGLGFRHIQNTYILQKSITL